MKTHIFYDERQSIDGIDSYSKSASKPARFVEAAKRAFHELKIHSFDPVTKEDLCEVHDPEYVDQVFKGAKLNGFDNRDLRVPESCLWTIGSLLAAMNHAHANNANACSPTSGFHHAGYDWGGGFCTFNGLLVSANKFISQEPGRRVGILDLDFHYGDGTENILLRSPDLRSSVMHHTAGRFFGNKYDLEEGDSKKFFAWLDSSISAINNFKPDVVIYQAGADMSRYDPLGGLLADVEMYLRDVNVFMGIDAPIAFNLAGGYQEPRGTKDPVINLHLNTLATSEMRS